MEISVFSRGIGECIIVRSPDEQWMIIDSLVGANKEPVALTYLRDIGVSLDKVSLILATHWHDDHIRGLSKIIRKCPAAQVAYSTVLCRDEFKSTVSKIRPVTNITLTSGVAELQEIGKIIAQDPHRRILASARTILFEQNGVRVEALSPSHEDVHQFLQEIEKWGGESDVQRVIVKPRRNDTSVAVVVHMSDDLLLLGADLEVRGALSGWQAVHESAWGQRGKGIFFKIAHHGSITGHYEPIWDEMLIGTPWAAITPYNRGRKKLPDSEDVQRIVERTENCYSAGRVDVVRSRRQHNTVQKTLNEAGIGLWRVDESLGQARFRKNVGTNWNVELFGEAHRLANAA